MTVHSKVRFAGYVPTTDRPSVYIIQPTKLTNYEEERSEA